MKERHDDGERVGLVGFHQHRQHLPVEVNLGVLGRDQRLDLFESFLVVEELLPLLNVRSEGLVGQAEFVEDDGGAVGAEGVAVKPDVQEPVVIVIRLRRGRVDQVAACGVFPLDTDFDGQRAILVEPNDFDVRHRQRGQRVLELALRVVPEHDPLALVVEQAVQGSLNLGFVHWLGCQPLRRTMRETLIPFGEIQESNDIPSLPRSPWLRIATGFFEPIQGVQHHRRIH